MFIIKLFFKLLVLPVVIVLSLLEILGIFAVYMVGMPLFLIARILFVLAAISYLGHVGPVKEALYILIFSFVIFAIPFLSGNVIGMISAFNLKLKAFIFS